MKTPRLADFDPNPKAPELASPLEDMPAIEQPREMPLEPREVSAVQAVPAAPGTSLFVEEDHVDMPTPSPAPPINQSPDAFQSARTEERPPVLSSVRPSVRVGKRTITRYSFEFYQDQIDSLRAFSLAEKRLGEQGSMSAMVREAIDAYLAKRHRLDE